MGWAPQYNPTGLHMAANFMEQEKQQKEKEKSDAEMVKGFMALHKASPELQSIAPVNDWGDVSANQIRGMMQGLKLVTEESTRRQRAAESQIQQQQAQQQISANQAMQDFRPSVMDLDNNGLPDAMMTQPGRAEPWTPPKNAGFSTQDMGVPRPVPGMSGASFVPTSAGGGQIVRSEPPVELPPVGHKLEDGAVHYGRLNSRGGAIYETIGGKTLYDVLVNNALQAGGGGGMAPQSGTLRTRKKFIKDFKEDYGREPNQDELTAANGVYWR